MKPIPRLIVVIHTNGNPSHALDQTQLALENGAGGVFLINHRVSARELQADYQHVREHCPNAWIGLNFLDQTNINAVSCISGLNAPDALWVDDCGIREMTTYSELSAFIAQYFVHKHWRTFASIAFKYQSPAKDLEGATISAAELYDVVVTSGPATGEAPTLEKLQRMRKAVGEAATIALASGVTAENVRDFMPYVDTFMVATGVSKEFYGLDDEKIREMHEILRTHPRW